MLWYKYIKPYKKQAITGFIFKMIEAFFELVVPIVVAHIIDYGIANSNTNYIMKMGLVLFLLTIIGYGCALICQYYASLTSQSVGTDLRNDLYKAINKFDYDNIDEIGTPSLITRLTNDTVQLQLAVAMSIRLISRSPFIIIGSIFMAFTIDARMAIIFLVATPILGLVIYIIMSFSNPIYTKIQKKLDEISLHTRENLSGVRVIRAFSRQEEEKEKFSKLTNEQKEMQIRVGKISALLNPASNIIINIAIIFILYLGGLRVFEGTLSQGNVVALINYMNQILLAMFAFANVIVILNKASASYKRVKEILEVEPTIVENDHETQEKEGPIISFKNVSLSYRGDQALSHIYFNIYEGETVGVIGGTGSGKTSLVNLIPRFYDIDSGELLIKGVPIQQYSLKKLRDMMGIVPQKAVLFSGTIRDNIRWGNREASDEDIKQALRLAQASSFEDDLDKYIVQQGNNLSGGQKQRLTIARALVKKPEILILDDSASALDFKTDAALRKALRSLDSTTFIVSQRVSSIMHCDHIIVLSHGEMVGFGTHRQLLEESEVYRETVRSQLSGEDAYGY